MFLTPDSTTTSRPLLGIIGFGAFGQLIARHLRHHFELCVHDQSLPLTSMIEFHDVVFTNIAVAASCPIIVLAVPVQCLRETVDAICPYVRPGSLVLDVGSVKIIPAEIMSRRLPEQVDIVATHPLFGPQSARGGLAGLKIAICPIRVRHGRRVIAFLRRKLRLNVILTTPEAHDREVATAQGLTHLIAKVLMQMEPLPTSMTTKSFDLIMQAVNMVRGDPPEVFRAIERWNPHCQPVRERFSELLRSLNAEIQDASPWVHSQAILPTYGEMLDSDMAVDELCAGKATGR